MIWNAVRHEPHHDKYKANVIQYYINWVTNQVEKNSAGY